MLEQIIFYFMIFCYFVIIYHHALYPFILRLLSRKLLTLPQYAIRKYQKNHYDNQLPTITLIIPAYNEEESIVAKIHNLGSIDYPKDKFTVWLMCDGCNDSTASLAKKAASTEENQHLHIKIIEKTINQGKVAILNEAISQCDADIIALSDVSALLSTDALLITATHLKSKKTGLICGQYQFYKTDNNGEQTYWNYQRNIKISEAKLGSILGAHGAFYAFKQYLFQKLPKDTINDDFILPTNIIKQGYSCLYDPRIKAIELEQSDSGMDFKRRVRIASGNTQQAFRCFYLLHPKHKYTAFNFFSGKFLRAFMPLIFTFIFLCTFFLTFNNLIFGLLFLGKVSVLAWITYCIITKIEPTFKPLKIIYYILSGHLAMGVGFIRYLLGTNSKHWQKIKPTKLPAKKQNRHDYNKKTEYNDMNKKTFMHPLCYLGKRSLDVAVSMTCLILSLPLLPIIALAIKLDSSGPVIYRQTRVGIQKENYIKLFKMIKFRTMVSNAETKTGAVWAKKNDTRITKVGDFLRKTRLDEIPQLWNVLMGDMSIVGPRPERPQMYNYIEKNIPLYSERTYGVIPGITGLAQINLGYDETIEDVRKKVAFDHAYSLNLTKPLFWLKSDIEIIFKTIFVMILGKGQ